MGVFLYIECNVIVEENFIKKGGRDLSGLSKSHRWVPNQQDDVNWIYRRTQQVNRAFTIKALREYLVVLNTKVTAEEAKNYFAQLNPKAGELADDELDNVSGGRKCGTI